MKRRAVSLAALAATEIVVAGAIDFLINSAASDVAIPLRVAVLLLVPLVAMGAGLAIWSNRTSHAAQSPAEVATPTGTPQIPAPSSAEEEEFAAMQRIQQLLDAHISARRMFQQGLELFEREQGAYWKHWTGGRAFEAVLIMKQAIRLDPRDGLTLVDRQLKQNPNSAVLWDLKGDALLALGRYKEAIDAYIHSLDIDPNDNTLTRSGLQQAEAHLKGLW